MVVFQNKIIFHPHELSAFISIRIQYMKRTCAITYLLFDKRIYSKYSYG